MLYDVVWLYVVLHRTTIFLHLHLPLTNVLKKHFFTFFYLEHMNFSLVWTGTYKPPSCMPHHIVSSPECSMMWRHILWRPATSSPYNMDLVWSSIKQSLSNCRDIYTYRAEVVGGEGTLGSGCGSLPWIEEALLLCKNTKFLKPHYYYYYYTRQPSIWVLYQATKYLSTIPCNQVSQYYTMQPSISVLYHATK